MAEKVEILCVDDEPQVVEGLKDLLEDRYQVHTATGGESALQLLAHRPQIAVIMSDMRMPVMDGAAFSASDPYRGTGCGPHASHGILGHERRDRRRQPRPGVSFSHQALYAG